MSDEKFYKRKLIHRTKGHRILILAIKKPTHYQVQVLATKEITQVVSAVDSFEEAKIKVDNLTTVYLESGDYRLETSILNLEVLTFLRKQYPEYATVQSPSGEVGIIIAITDNGSLRVQGPKDIYTLPFGTYGAFEVVT